MANALPVDMVEPVGRGRLRRITGYTDIAPALSEVFAS
jgi:hypothetical protein